MSQVELVDIPLLSPAPQVRDGASQKASGWSAQVTALAVGALALVALLAVGA